MLKNIILWLTIFGFGLNAGILITFHRIESVKAEYQQQQEQQIVKLLEEARLTD